MMMETIHTDVVIVGAGGCGLTAALTAAENGAKVVVLEKEQQPGGNTRLSAGLVIAAGSQLQHTAGEPGTAEELAQDIWRANGGESDRQVTLELCRISGEMVNWTWRHGVPWELMGGYRYPGHSRAWLHATPERNGEPIVGALTQALLKQRRADLRVGTPAVGLVTDDSGVVGVRSGDGVEVRAARTILAADGFGANRALLRRFIPDMEQALYFGAPGNTGDAIEWGMELGAATNYMDSYQPHSSIAFPERIFVTSYLINNGAFQVNQQGRRFGNETRGYSEHALAVQRQTGGVAFEIFDRRIREQAEASYARFYEAVDAGVIRSAQSPVALAEQLGIDAQALGETLDEYRQGPVGEPDEFGRPRLGRAFEPPLYGIRVTSALFHTQGGLVIDSAARVLRPDGSPIANLYAGGGTAAGFSGGGCRGYLGGVGLLSALGLGRIAGQSATARFTERGTREEPEWQG